MERSNKCSLNTFEQKTIKTFLLAHNTYTYINQQIMPSPSLTTLIGDEIQGRDKWWDFVDGKDGFFYGIPSNARRVVKFNPILDKSLTEIGPDLGDGACKWWCGVRAKNGKIYCTPLFSNHILIIDTIQGTVETLDDIELPETGDYLWASGALAQDNHIYFMPYRAHRIMKLNTDNDSLSSVGGDLGYGGLKYRGTVVGNDDCVYGMPYQATHIVKFDLHNPDTTSTVGEEAEEEFYCRNGVLSGDGHIYAANGAGQVLKIDTRPTSTSNSYTWIGDQITESNRGFEWGDPILGVDKCVYWPPFNANRVLKFDPETQQFPSLVGDDLGRRRFKWQGGALAYDEAIYCIPACSSTQILVIDPFKELAKTMQNNIIQYPKELGWLFAKKNDGGRKESIYGNAVRKFGIEKVFKFLFEECLPSDREWADTHSGNNLPLFMLAASCESCTVSVIYHLLRRNVHDVST
jgi:hypothetical protein